MTHACTAWCRAPLHCDLVYSSDPSAERALEAVRAACRKHMPAATVLRIEPAREAPPYAYWVAAHPHAQRWSYAQRRVRRRSGGGASMRYAFLVWFRTSDEQEEEP
jgi:hypothetical protein